MAEPPLTESSACSSGKLVPLLGRLEEKFGVLPLAVGKEPEMVAATGAPITVADEDDDWLLGVVWLPDDEPVGVLEEAVWLLAAPDGAEFEVGLDALEGAVCGAVLVPPPEPPPDEQAVRPKRPIERARVRAQARMPSSHRLPRSPSLL